VEPLIFCVFTPFWVSGMQLESVHVGQDYSCREAVAIIGHNGGRLGHAFRGTLCNPDADDPGKAAGQCFYVAYHHRAGGWKTQTMERHDTWQDACRRLKEAEKYPGFDQPRVWVGTPTTGEEIRRAAELEESPPRQEPQQGDKACAMP
jgi:hypothetical protein